MKSDILLDKNRLLDVSASFEQQRVLIQSLKSKVFFARKSSDGTHDYEFCKIAEMLDKLDLFYKGMKQCTDSTIEQAIVEISKFNYMLDDSIDSVKDSRNLF